jgi:hypothetical protein
MSELAREGVELRVGHYWASRGLNAWIGVAVHATIADANPNLDAITAEANFFKCKVPGALLYRRAQAEREQSSMRARPSRGAVVVVHYGQKAPDLNLAPQWRGMTVESLGMGRPKRTVSGSVPTQVSLDAERARLGLSKRADAKRLGVPLSTYLGWTGAGDRLPQRASSSIVLEIVMVAEHLAKTLRVLRAVTPVVPDLVHAPSYLVTVRDGIATLEAINDRHVVRAAILVQGTATFRFALPVSSAEAMACLSGNLRVRVQRDGAVHTLSYECDGGAGASNVSIADAASFLAIEPELTKATEQGCVPSAVLADGVARAITALAPIRSHAPEADRSVWVRDGCVWAHGLSFRADTLAGIDIVVAKKQLPGLLEFLRGCHWYVRVRVAPEYTFFVRSDGEQMFACRNGATTPARGTPLPPRVRTKVRLPKSKLLSAIGVINGQRPCPRDEYRAGKGELRLIVSRTTGCVSLRYTDNLSNTVSEPIRATEMVGVLRDSELHLPTPHDLDRLRAFANQAAGDVVEMQIVIDAGNSGTVALHLADSYWLNVRGRVVGGDNADRDAVTADAPAFRCTVGYFIATCSFTSTPPKVTLDEHGVPLDHWVEGVRYVRQPLGCRDVSVWVCAP